MEDEIQRAHGSAGLRALQRWEEGLNMAVRRNKRSALDVFEAQYAEHWASGKQALASAFDDLRRTVRVLLVSEALSSRDTETAFRYADDSSLRDVQSALAPDAAILRYATTKYDHIVAFVIRRDSVDVVTLHDAVNRHPEDQVGFVPHGDSVEVARLRVRPDSAHRVEAEIATTAARMRGAADPMAASLLHELVIAPVLEKLHGISTIAVIPNFDLAEIPFGALFDVGRGQYLAERFTIVHAPSARAAVELSKRTRDSRDSTLLAIGATQFDRTQGEVLAGVDREIAQITARSLCARVLSGEQATPEAVQRALGENAVFITADISCFVARICGCYWRRHAGATVSLRKRLRLSASAKRALWFWPDAAARQLEIPTQSFERWPMHFSLPACRQSLQRRTIWLTRKLRQPCAFSTRFSATATTRRKLSVKRH
ncbi:MAG TPA: CHAT domain-containing protein [Thermoanaerobaculia bacterium]|nr:CHAT domain-containing protein [Thermoanaerobaculia bacterium]